MKTTQLTVYYAHPMALYGTPVETRDVKTLKGLGFKVLNPASRELPTMDDYIQLAISCDLVAFRSFDDGKVGSGMALEVEAAQKVGRPVLELAPFLPGRILTRNETRQRMCLPPLRHPDTAPLRTVDDDIEPLDQDWGNS